MLSFQEVCSHFRISHQGDNHAQCFCPVHAGGREKKPSLSLSRGRDGCTLVYCHVCGKEGTEEILNAVGLSFSDILPDRRGRKKTVREFAEWPGKNGEYEGAEFVASYDYANPEGYAYTKCRVKLPDGKTFRYCRTDTQCFVTEFRVKDRQEYKAMFPFSAIQKAREGSKQILVVEGEKDAINANNNGFNAITAGASGDWIESLADYFAGLNVTVVPDNDEPGYKSALRVVEDLVKHGVSVKVISWPDNYTPGDGTDYTDFVYELDDPEFGALDFQKLIDEALQRIETETLERALNGKNSAKGIEVVLQQTTQPLGTANELKALTDDELQNRLKAIARELNALIGGGEGDGD